MRKRPGNYQQIVVRAKQSAYMPDGTILSIWVVGVRWGSVWREIDEGTPSLCNKFSIAVHDPDTRPKSNV